MDHKIYKKVVLVVLDGFGVAHESNGNAISLAKTPSFDYLVSNFPSMSLQASGPLVGLPWGEMGNSEVGHLNIGAGRIVGQDLPRITMSIQNGQFFKNKAFLGAVEHVRKNNSKLHLIGMISPGGVHSLDEHLYALLGLAKNGGLEHAYIHMFTDGRDTEPKVALDTVKQLRARMERIGVGTIASIAGRFYAMDRGGHWGQTETAYQVLVNGKGEVAESAEEAISQNYNRQISDEMIPPTVIVEKFSDGQEVKDRPVATISENDAVIFFNFRSDRALQLTRDFVEPAAVPEQFRHQSIANLYFVTMTEYARDLPVVVAFSSTDIKNSLAEVLANSHLTQFHTAESEKYAHVTVFFNGGHSEKLDGEERLIIDSPSNSHNYSDQPEMSAELLTSELVKRISEGHFNFYLANYANADMVGHTGVLPAGVKAVECLDGCIKKILDACLVTDAVLLVTADHGNIEQMVNQKTGDIDKDHTTNPVPLLIAANEFKFARPREAHFCSLAARIPVGCLSDIAPTVLDLFGLPKPPEMTGVNLLEEETE